MEKQRILITGGHSGIGLDLTKTLLKEGHKIGLIVRNAQRKKDALLEFEDNTSIDFFFADLSDQVDVTRVIKDINDKWERIDILFNNAGVLFNEKRMSKQTNEMHFEVNTLSTYALTIGLKNLLSKSNNSVVVNTVTGMLQNRKIDVKDLINPIDFKGLMGSYMQSKSALLLLMNGLSIEWKDIRIVSVNPGPNKTKMTLGDKAGTPGWMKPMIFLMTLLPSKGGELLYKGAFDEKHENKTGIYLQGNKITEMKIEINEVQKNGILERIVK